MADLTGTTLCRRYRVDGLVGHGGMSDVYKVWDLQRSVYLAMKVLHEDIAEDKVFLRRFKREAQTLARLQHPHVVHYYGLEQENRTAFMLMDFVEGHSLRQEIFDATGPFELDRVIQVMQPVCAALNYAHSEGIVHCDVKPANILIDRAGRILVSDFGISRMTEAATVTLVGAGTPAYMAPEQVRGDAPKPANDVYSLGVVLFEMLTGGERPFTGEHARTTGTTGEKIRWEQANLKPPSPRKFNPGLSRALEVIVLRCLDKEPQNRYASATELLAALEECRAKPAPAEAPVARRPIPPIMETAAERGEPAPRTTQTLRHVAPPAPPRRTVRQALSAAAEALAPRLAWMRTWRALAGGAVVVVLGVLAVLASPSRLPLLPSSPIVPGGLYFTSAREGSTQIYYMNVRTGDTVRVTHPSNGANWAPMVVSTSWMYFTSNRSGSAQIYAMNLRTMQAAPLTHPGEGANWSPVVSGGGILYFVSDRDGSPQIYWMDPRTQKATRLTDPGRGDNWSPAVTSTGLLYFVSNRDGSPQIYWMDVQTGKSQRLTDPGHGANWSPAATAAGILYFTSDRDGSPQVYWMDVSKGKPQRLTDPGSGANWSPVVSSGGLLYFTSNRDGGPQIYWAHIGRMQSTRLTQPSLGHNWSIIAPLEPRPAPPAGIGQLPPAATLGWTLDATGAD